MFRLGSADVASCTGGFASAPLFPLLFNPSRPPLGIWYVFRASRPYQNRRARVSTTISVKELPQGILCLRQPIEKQAMEDVSYPTVIQQALTNMRRLDDCVLLTRVGGFYELYFEHAEDFGPLLNLKVAYKKTTAGLVPMVFRVPRRHVCDDILTHESRGFRSFN